MKRSLCSAAQSMTADESLPRKRSSAAPPAGSNEYKWLHGQGLAFYQFDWNIYNFAPAGSAELPANDATDPNATRPVHPAPYLNVDGGGVLPVGYSEYHRLSFYNISWNAKSNKPWHTMKGLAIEVCEMVHDKCIDAVGICGVFDLRDDPWCAGIPWQRDIILWQRDDKTSWNILYQNSTAVLNGLRGKASRMDITYSSGIPIDYS